ncbi:MAG: hypothetical protein IIC87_05085 [Chloroflexi bacterium]|nr:hypothetical protein [Chloroflexota bacterium]
MLARWVLTIVATVALVGAVVASAASISVGGVDELGSGEASVDAPEPTVTVTDVVWNLNLNDVCNDAAKVARVDVTFAIVNPGEAYTNLRFTLKGIGGAVLRDSGTLFDGQSLNGGIGTTIQWSLGATAPGFPGGCVSAAAITEFAVTVVDDA